MFSDDDRKIFEFSDGTKTIKADPLVIRRKLLVASAGEFWDLLAQGHRPADAGKEALEIVMAREDAQEKVVLCVRAAFDLPPVDPGTGQGCTEAMCWAVLGRYLDLLEGNAPAAGK